MHPLIGHLAREARNLDIAIHIHGHAGLYEFNPKHRFNFDSLYCHAAKAYEKYEGEELLEELEHDGYIASDVQVNRLCELIGVHADHLRYLLLVDMK